LKAKILSEHGYEEATLGISLSWASNVERSKQIAPNLAHKQGGHNKFLEMIFIWMDVEFSRGVWQECDTYRVGSTKQSASTMHTITKGSLTQENFEYPIFNPTLEYINQLIALHNASDAGKKELFLQIKNNLPEGFLQRRIWCVNYKTLQNIYHQRINHKLPQWKNFLNSIMHDLEHPEFITKDTLHE
jgi:hypothetical protein